MREFWEKGILEPLLTLRDQAAVFLPNLLQSLIIVIVGVAVGVLLREIVSRGLRLLNFDRLCARLGVTTAVERVGGFRSPSVFTGHLIQWFIIVLALLTGLNALNTEVSNNLMDRFLGYLPHLIVAGFILLLGAIISRFLGRAVLLAAVNANLAPASLVAGAVRFLVMTLAAVAALEHLGIGQATLLVAFGVIFGGAVLALAIAFGLGGRELAQSLLEKKFRRPAQEEDEGPIRHL